MSDPSPPPLADDSAAMSPRLRWWIYATIITAAATVSFAALCNSEPLQSANDRSRWGTVWSLVERGTYRIDEIILVRGWDTIDKVRHEGHFYSSKPALYPTLVAGLYWTVKQITGWNLLDDTALVTQTILVIVNLIPFAVSLVLWARIAERYAGTDRARIFLVIAAAFATILSTFLVTLNNHTIAAASVLFALYSAMRIVIDGSRCPGHFALAGFFAAFACTNELPAALFGVLLFLVLCRHAPKRTLAVFVPAALVPLAAYFVCNYLQTGGWKPFYAYYGTEKYIYEIDGVPSYWSQPTAIDRGGDSPLVYFLHCTFGHHGIFSLSPIFLFSILGWMQLRRRSISIGTFLGLGLLLTVVTLGFYLTRTDNYNYGGNTAGLRWMLWLVPFWLLAIIPPLDRWAARRWFQALAVFFLAVSVFSAWYPLTNPWQHPWMFRLMQEWGWVDVSTPPPKLEPAPTTWFRTLPSDTDASPYWIELEGADVDGRAVRLRLEDGGTQELEGRPIRRLVATWNPRTEAERQQTYFIDIAGFAAGQPPSKFLRWPGSPPSREKELEARYFLRGLPLPDTYSPSSIRYLKTPARNDAFRCIYAAAGVNFRPPSEPRELRYRSDVWYCDDLPFGVAQYARSVTDPSTGVTLSRQQLTIVAASNLQATIDEEQPVDSSGISDE